MPDARKPLELVVQARRASAALDRIRAIHSPVDAVMYANGRQYPRQVCTGCGTDDGNWQIWPCPTIRAMEGR